MTIRRLRTVQTTDASGDITAVSLTLATKFAKVLSLGFSSTDASTNYTLLDANGRTVYSLATVDGSTAIRLPLVHDAFEASDGAAAVNQGNIIVRSPLTLDIADGGNAVAHTVDIFYEDGYQYREKQITTDASGDATGTLSLGVPFALVENLYLDSTGDASTNYTVVSGGAAGGFTCHIIAALDADPGVYKALCWDGFEGSDGAGIVNEGRRVMQSPLHITIAAGGNAITHRVGAFFKP